MKLDSQEVLSELTRLARIASGLVDGEDVKQIITEHAMTNIAKPDTRYRFLSADHYDVEHAPFLRMKKLLMRIERLANVVVNGAIWVRVPETDAVTVALHNGPHHRYYQFGSLQRQMPPEMKRAFETGETVAAPRSDDDTHAAVLAPIRDSLQDIVGVVELTAPLDPDAPAWS